MTKGELVLRAIHLAKLPYLLSSDLVAGYIPHKLSQTGLNHLEETLKSLPLFACPKICYKSQSKELPDVMEKYKSLWDAVKRITDDSATRALFPKCSRAQARLKHILDIN